MIEAASPTVGPPAYESFLETRGDVVEEPRQPRSCQEPVWDGPYRMTCGYTIVNGRCVRHGKVGRGH